MSWIRRRFIWDSALVDVILMPTMIPGILFLYPVIFALKFRWQLAAYFRTYPLNFDLITCTRTLTWRQLVLRARHVATLYYSVRYMPSVARMFASQKSVRTKQMSILRAPTFFILRSRKNLCDTACHCRRVVWLTSTHTSRTITGEYQISIVPSHNIESLRLRLHTKVIHWQPPRLKAGSRVDALHRWSIKNEVTHHSWTSGEQHQPAPIPTFVVALPRRLERSRKRNACDERDRKSVV